MTDKTTGFVAYGSGDSSIILETPLTSQASVLTPTIGPAGNERTAGSISYDSELGITYADGSNAAASWTDAGVFGVMGYAYQVSYEIETKFISELSPDASGNIGGSEGITHTAAQANVAFHSLSDSIGAGSYGKANAFRQAANSAFWPKASNQNAAGTPSRGVHSVGKDRFCLVTMSVIGDKVDLYIDRGLQGTGSNANGGDAVERFYIGSDRGNTDRGLHSGYHIRNLVVSSRPVNIPVLDKTRKIVWLGDSFTNQAGQAYGTNLFDAKVEISLEREFHKRGIGIGEQSFNSVSGGTWWDDGATIQTALPAAIADDGDIYMLYGGWNDCSQNTGASLNAGTEAGLKLVIDDIIAITRASAIVIINQTAFQGLSTHPGSQYNGNVHRFNTMLKTLAAYAETVKAGWGDKVFISNAFAACDGDSIPDNYSKGGLSGAFDDQHPSAYQSTVVGKTAGISVISNVLK